MCYVQVTRQERYEIYALRALGMTAAEIARYLGRHRSTVSRELRRNQERNGRYDAARADSRARTRRSWSRRNRRYGYHDWVLIVRLLKAQWSPEQIAGRLRLEGLLRISHGTIYNRIWQERLVGGTLHPWLRCGAKPRRRRGGTYLPRGTGQLGRSITERPARVARRREVGHWEIDTVLGGRHRACVLTAVERVSGLVAIEKLAARTAGEVNRALRRLTRVHQIASLTADNGSEMAGHPVVTAQTGVDFYFAHPRRAWERGINENANGLIREFLPKRASMASVTQRDCYHIARQLNHRPRKRLGYLTPAEVYASSGVALQT